MAKLDPDGLIELRWRDNATEFQKILAKLIEQADVTLMISNKAVLARAILELLRDNTPKLTPNVVVAYIKEQLVPPGGWLGFDERRWLGQMPEVLDNLSSDKPRKVLTY